MNNIIAKIKTALLNKNTVTILAVLAGVIVLWFIYNTTLNRAISPIKVPVANKDLFAGTVITMDDITYIEINSEFAKKASVITNTGKLVNYYVANGTSIPNGGLFYSSQVVDKAQLKERDLEDIEKGNTIYWLKVDNTSTYANSIYPGDRIDLWLRVQNNSTNNLIVYEEFIKSIEVLAVKDSNGQNVFDSNVAKTPNWLAFSVTTEMYSLLHNIEDLGGMQLFPVPRNKQYTTEEAETEYANEELKALVESLVLPLGN